MKIATKEQEERAHIRTKGTDWFGISSCDSIAKITGSERIFSRESKALA